MWRFIALPLLSFALVACSDHGPEDAVRGFLSSLEASRVSTPSAGELKGAYSLLDDSAQRACDALAARVTAEIGVELSPWEVLRYGGAAQGDRVSAVETVEQGADRAVVEVRFAWAVPSDEGGPGIAPDPVRIELVTQGGDWRLRLPLCGEVAP